MEFTYTLDESRFLDFLETPYWVKTNEDYEKYARHLKLRLFQKKSMLDFVLKLIQEKNDKEFSEKVDWCLNSIESFIEKSYNDQTV